MSKSKGYESSDQGPGSISPSLEIPILGLTRRRFLGCAAAGLAGAVAASSRAMAFPGDQDVSDPDAEAGFVTVDGFMLTYFTAPPAIASSTFTFEKNFSATITLGLPQNPDIKLVARVPVRDEEPTTGEYSEYESQRVTNGIILRSNFNRFVRGSKDGGGTGPFPPGPTIFYGLWQPVLKFIGTPEKLRFFFPSMIGEFSGSSDILTQIVDPVTASSMINLAPADSSSLVPPRFEPFPTISGAQTLDLVLPSTLLSGKTVEATATCKVISQTGFTSAALQQAFAVGNDIRITYSSIQEYPSANLMELQSTLATASFDTQVFVDKLFKTFVIV